MSDIKSQKTRSLLAKGLIYFSFAATIGILLWIVIYVAFRGIPNLTKNLFAWSFTTENSSMVPSIINTLEIILISLAISVPLGIFTAIYLVEYADNSSKFVKLVRLATETLQGIPSIIYGLFGYVFFNIALGWGYALISGALTMSIMVLPLIIRASEEALMAVDPTYREASFGLGARKLRTIFNVVLPSAANGIFSGIVLAIGRVFGETAALIFTAGTVQELAGPTNSGASLAIHMYLLQSEGTHVNEAYATAVILLVFVVILNLLSSFLENKIKRG